MNKIKFISTAYLKSNTTIQDNVEDDILNPYIHKVQDTHLQQVLGTSFYNRLKTGVEDNNLSTNELSLLRTYIQPMVAEWTFYEVLPHINYRITNKAVSQQSSEFSQASGLDEVKYLRQTVRDMAEFYTKRLQKYLCDYGQLYTEYVNPGDKENIKKNIKKGFFNGVYIPKNNM